ncbi:putative Leucine-rich repeat receptor-like serine/threonine-protein kinase BAM1 [Cocos nucifera]|uniref:Putative Leucine-rich repeat receptor-like serine/threonine-protein kinase BAM1 n=1 Tax=Cocos nucifera TaxID=13894 RepID=A0A8K0I081_COCNU|nr:putative Leucine-rich repeat receptor-like serine/threonine-protein kinase BAM1 [Cocos nucifera]
MTDSNKQAVTNILDPRLSSVPLHDVMHVFYVAMLCVEEQSVERPTMREVVQILSELPRPTPKPEEEDSSNSEECGAPAPVPSAETPRKETKEQQQQPAPRSPPPDLLSI